MTVIVEHHISRASISGGLHVQYVRCMQAYTCLRPGVHHLPTTVSKPDPPRDPSAFKPNKLEKARLKTCGRRESWLSKKVAVPRGWITLSGARKALLTFASQPLTRERHLEWLFLQLTGGRSLLSRTSTLVTILALTKRATSKRPLQPRQLCLAPKFPYAFFVGVS